MPSPLTGYRIFIASPGGLQEIRKAFRELIEKYNTEDAMRRGVVFIPVGWEHTLGGIGRPQALINKDLDECDGFVMVLHDRWGSNAGGPDGVTGTEEEFNRALELSKAEGNAMEELLVFFKSVETERLSDPGPQLQKVLDFRARLERDRTLLFQQVETTRDFEDRLRSFLAEWVRRHEGGSRKGQNRPVGPAPSPPAAGEGPGAGPLETNRNEPGPPGGMEGALALEREGRFTEAETIYAELSAANDDPAMLSRYGDFLWRRKRRGQAAAIYRQAVETADALGDDLGRSSALLKLGHLLTKRGDYDEAGECIQLALQLAENSGAPSLTALAYLRSGELAGELGKPEDAERSFGAGMEALADSDDPATRADLLAALAQGCADRGDYAGAARSYREALELKEGSGTTDDVADILVGLGSAEEMLENPRGAAALYERSLVLFEAENEPAGRADALDHLGHAFKAMGKPQEALRFYEESAALFESIQKYDSAADVFSSMGKLLFEAKRELEAVSAFRQSLAHVGRLKNREEIAELYESLSTALHPGDGPQEAETQTGAPGKST